MATKIVTKNSSTASAVPTSSDLVQGELAVNVADKRLFTEDNAGAIVELGTNPTTLNVNGTATMDGLVVDGGAISTGDFTGTAAGSVRISGNGTTLGTTSFDLIQNSSGAYVYHRENLPLIFGTNDTERMRIDSSGNLLVGTSGTLYGTAGRGVLEVNGSSSSIAALKVNNAAAGYMYHSGTNMDVWNNLSGYLRFATSGAERMRIDASGILSFSETSSASFPARSINAYNNGYTYLTGGVNGLILKDAGMSGSRVQINATTMQFETNGAERMRIDSDGRALYGTTDTTLYSNTSGNGALINGGGGEMQIACNNSAPMWLNRMGNDGEIIKLYKAGATVGSIGTNAATMYVSAPQAGGMKYSYLTSTNAVMLPVTTSGANADGLHDLGMSNARFKDLYLSGTATMDGLDVDGTITAYGLNFDVSDGVEINALESIVFDIDSDNNQTSRVFQVKANNSTPLFTIAEAGNVGIGTSSPDNQLHVHNTAGDSFIRLSGGGSLGQNYGGFVRGFGVSGSGGNLDLGVIDNNAFRTAINVQAQGNEVRFSTGGTERMRIDSSGNLMVGTTSGATSRKLFVQSSNYPQQNYATNSSINYPTLQLRTAYATGGQTATQIDFRNGADGLVGTIKSTVSSTSYNTSSDYRLKENVVELTGATERLKQLNPSRFNFIADADTTVDGFLAHEVADVVPEAIVGEKDAVDADGNPEYQGIDQSKLVPLLVATIQELEARITQLENN